MTKQNKWIVIMLIMNLLIGILNVVIFQLGIGLFLILMIFTPIFYLFGMKLTGFYWSFLKKVNDAPIINISINNDKWVLVGLFVLFFFSLIATIIGNLNLLTRALAFPGIALILPIFCDDKILFYLPSKSTGDGMKIEIQKLIKLKLKRNITNEEVLRILKPRGSLGYEAIIDTLNDESMSVKELEEYLNGIL